MDIVIGINPYELKSVIMTYSNDPPNITSIIAHAINNIRSAFIIKRIQQDSNPRRGRCKSPPKPLGHEFLLLYKYNSLNIIG
jgi:hypothetical protein